MFSKLQNFKTSFLSKTLLLNIFSIESFISSTFKTSSFIKFISSIDVFLFRLLESKSLNILSAE